MKAQMRHAAIRLMKAAGKRIANTIQAQHFHERCGEVVGQSFVADVFGKEDRQSTLCHRFGDFSKSHFVVVQAGRHAQQIVRAQTKRDEQQRDDEDPFPAGDLMSLH